MYQHTLTNVTITIVTLTIATPSQGYYQERAGCYLHPSHPLLLIRCWDTICVAKVSITVCVCVCVCVCVWVCTVYESMIPSDYSSVTEHATIELITLFWSEWTGHFTNTNICCRSKFIVFSKNSKSEPLFSQIFKVTQNTKLLVSPIVLGITRVVIPSWTEWCKLSVMESWTSWANLTKWGWVTMSGVR